MSGAVVALSGGVGGAKLVLGLAQILPGEDLLVVANTADDFEHLGFHICPDIDTLLYTLAGWSDTTRGWGLADETWTFMEQVRRDHPEQAWFQLGDKDLETHRLRTRELAGGATLTEVTATLAQRAGVPARILPMSDDPVRTCMRVDLDGVHTWLPFQEYFVKHRCEPRILDLAYGGHAEARLQPQLTALPAGAVAAVLLGPSNPFLSIDPILSVPGMAEQLRAWGAPVVAVSPIVSGMALKGPAAKIMQELGLPVDVVSVAQHYHGLIDGLVIDRSDRQAVPLIEALGIEVAVEDTVMQSLDDRVRVARACLEFAAAIRG